MHTSPNRQIHLWLSPSKATTDSKNGMRVQNTNKYKIQDSEKAVKGNLITNTMLQKFRAGWHDRATSSQWRARVGT